MKFFGGIVEISTISDTQYPGDKSGNSMVATLKGSADKGETAQIYSQPGFIGKPSAGTKGIRFRIGSIDIIVASLNYSVAPPTNQGETKVYSTDEEGNEKASHYLDGQGVHTFNNGSDFAVAFDDLKAQFNELKTAFNSHTHIYSPGPSTPIATASPLPQSAANIDLAKVEEVKLP